jgi:hypothetical protein
MSFKLKKTKPPIFQKTAESRQRIVCYLFLKKMIRPFKKIEKNKIGPGVLARLNSLCLWAVFFFFNTMQLGSFFFYLIFGFKKIDKKNY